MSNSTIHINDEHIFTRDVEVIDWWTGIPEYRSGVYVQSIRYSCSCGTLMDTQEEATAHLCSLGVEVGS